MTDPTQLEVLAQRSEQATVPDRVLDAEIALFAPICTADYVSYAKVSERAGMVTRHFTDGGHGTFVCERYTASVDAALTLVPEGWEWLITKVDGKNRVILGTETPNLETVSGRATDLALAITAAALRAHAARELAERAMEIA